MQSNSVPWWIGFPLSAGFGVMGVFAPDVFPAWLKTALFVAGAILAIWGVVAGIWHYRSVWRRRVSATLLVGLLGAIFVFAGVALVWMSVATLLMPTTVASTPKNAKKVSSPVTAAIVPPAPASRRHDYSPNNIVKTVHNSSAQISSVLPKERGNSLMDNSDGRLTPGKNGMPPAGTGIAIVGAAGVRVENGSVSKAKYGIITTGDNTTISNVDVSEIGDGTPLENKK